jgi:uncharacterized protein (DUF2164 family)
MLNREQIIEQIKFNIKYYSQFVNPDSGHYSAIYAQGALESLEEILKQAEEYDESVDVIESCKKLMDLWGKK